MGQLITVLFTGALIFFSASAQADETYTVEGVNVDVTDQNPVQARNKAIAEAQRQALTTLLERLLPPAEAASYKHISEDRLDALVQDFQIQNEKHSNVRYLGAFKIRFRPEAVDHFIQSPPPVPTSASDERPSEEGEVLPSVQKNFSSPPMVVIPVIERGGKIQLWEEGNPWLQAWNQVDLEGARLTVPVGDLQDREALSPEEILHFEGGAFTRILNRYQTPQALVVKITEGAPLTLELFQVGRSGLVAMSEPTPVEGGEGLDEASLSKILAKALLLKDQLVQDTKGTFGLQKTEVRIPLHSHKEWLAWQEDLKSVPMMRRLEISSLSRMEARVILHHMGSPESFEKILARENLSLVTLKGSTLPELRRTSPKPLPLTPAATPLPSLSDGDEGDEE